MKRIFAMMLALFIMLSMSVIGISAAETSADVWVTITDKDGNIAVAAEKISVSDVDGDGVLTVNDTLIAAHDKFYEGGAAAGYATEVSQYGLGITKLWGTANGGSYGYYVNNAQAWSLQDTIESDAYIVAYVYTDLAAWSDQYSFFDAYRADAAAGEEFSLTLSAVGFDENWATVTAPVAGAEITVNGEPTGIKTDAQGNAAITIDSNGTYIISAKSDTQTLVPPVMKVTVTGGEEEEETSLTEATEASAATAATAATTATTKAVTTANTASVKTGESCGWLFVLLGVAVLAVTAMFVRAKKEYEE